MDFGAPKYVPVRQFLLDSSSAGRVGTGPHPKLLKVECRGTSSCQNISLYEPEQSLSLSQDEGEQC